MENNQPSIKSNLTHYKDEIDGFLVRNEVKEKISSFASASYEKVFFPLKISSLFKLFRRRKNAKNIKLKKKALIFFQKQKNFSLLMSKRQESKLVIN